MKFSTMKSAMLLLFLFVGAAICGAATLTVGPGKQYATPCPAIKAAASGDTITIDYNNGVPYTEPADPTHGSRSDCVWFTDNLTIVGVNGRPVLDAAGEIIEKGIFNPYGANNVISNLEFRNAATQSGQGDNGAGIRVDSGSTASPAGGNITVQFCYLHNNQDGILTANVGPGTGGQYESANPYITLLNDEFAFNGQGGDGHTHNMYIGFDGGNTTTFTLKYSWTHDVLLGHTIKSRAPINNVEYNLVTDQWGATSYLLNFPLGGSTYVVGNSFYKSQKTNSGANGGWMLWRDVGDNTPTDPEYGLPLEDLHFINNTVVLDPSNNTPAYVIASCIASDVSSCSAPSNGPVLSVNEVVQNNIFIGPATLVTNQSTAVQSHNIVESNTPANLAAMFVDWAHFNFHLVSGAPAIQAGLYPPTDNTGAADPKALAVYEYVHPMSYVARPTPSGSTMDDGAYSYPRVDTPPSPSLSYTTSVTTPGTGTITLSGLPTPPAGQYNNAVFISGNTTLIPAISSASSTTGTITQTFSTCCATASTVVPIDIYVDGAHLTANVTVVPGSVALQSITLDGTYYPGTTVHLTNASSSPVVVNLSTTDASILAVPSSVTIPAGQLSAETGSETGSLWGQTPGTKTATISATYAGTTKTLPVVVYAPRVNHFYCNVYNPGCEVVGGQPVAFQVAIAGDFPAGGGPVTFTSSNTAVIPNQTFTGPAGNFYTGFNLTTNSVTSSQNVTISISVNGSTKLPNQVVTVTPATGTGIAVYSGNGQSSPVGTSFPNPLAVYVSNNGSALSGATVTFSGSGVSFPGGATAVTNSSGIAQVTVTPTASGALTVNATVSGASGPAAFSETGGSGSTPASVAVVSGSGQTSTVGTSFTNPLVVVVKDSSNNPVSGVTVTYAGSGVSFPSGATATTNSSGQASVTAQPTATGALTVTASVAGVGTPASFSETGTSSAGGDVVAINASGSAAGTYVADTDFSGGATSTFGNSVDTSAVTNPAPQAVYQSQRYGNFTYTIPGLTIGSNYTVRLHFAELYWSGTGQRVFNVTINGTQVLTNFDILATAGAANKAVIETFSTTANSSGQILIQFTTVTDNAAVNGIEIQSGTGSTPGLNSDFATTPAMTPGQGIYTYNPTNVANWAFSGSSGVAENGSAWGFTTPTDGANQVAFLQNTGSITQTLTGLTTGQQYSLSFYLEGRPGFTANTVAVSVGGTTLASLTPGSGWTLYNETFTATGTSEVLSFSTSGSPSGDIDSGLSDVTLSTVTGVALSSITQDSPYNSGTTVHLVSAAPAGGQVVTLSSSDSSIEYVPASVTVPAGATSVETGSLLGSLWGQSPFNKTATVTGVAGGVTQTLTMSVPTTSVHAFSPNSTVQGGQSLGFYMETSFNQAPVGGAPYTVSSDQPSIIPTQSFTLAAGQGNDFGRNLTTNTVSTNTTVNLTLNYNGVQWGAAVTVTP